jgi:hypothetical protein
VSDDDFLLAMAHTEAELDAERRIRTYIRWCRSAARCAMTQPNSHFYAALAVVLESAIHTDRHRLAVLVADMLSVDIAKAHDTFAQWYATMPRAVQQEIGGVRQAMQAKEALE